MHGSMLWQRYVLRRGPEVQDAWEALFARRPARVLYIVGRGFDLRARLVLGSFVESLRSSGASIEKADLLMVGVGSYELSSELADLTEVNARSLREIFSEIGQVTEIPGAIAPTEEEEASASSALRRETASIIAAMVDRTDVILDVSSLPRVMYLSFLTAILEKLIPIKDSPLALYANGVNFQVLVAEDAALDAQIRSEDPSKDLAAIPGFSSAMHAETSQEWPPVWFPILGENRTSQLEQVALRIPADAEICPVLPHPSRHPRRADKLLVEYLVPLFRRRATPAASVLYAHESNPFEAYRQLLGAMRRYRDSLTILGGCRLLVTPLGSKLITLGAGLACFEMRPTSMAEKFAVGIPYAEATRYAVSAEALRASKPEVSAMLLTGEAYS